MELEQGKNVDFWRDMTTITEDEISKLRKLEASGKGPGAPPQPLIGPATWTSQYCSLSLAHFLSWLSTINLYTLRLGISPLVSFS